MLCLTYDNVYMLHHVALQWLQFQLDVLFNKHSWRRQQILSCVSVKTEGRIPKSLSSLRNLNPDPEQNVATATLTVIKSESGHSHFEPLLEYRSELYRSDLLGSDQCAQLQYL